MLYSVIRGTGRYIPPRCVTNAEFLANEFYAGYGEKVSSSSSEIIEKFGMITGIQERRYIPENMVSSDMATIAAEEAIKSSGIDRESFDYLIVAHNFGDVKAGGNRSDFVPSLAARVKQNLGITNPRTIAYDLTFGCPGWLQAIIQANYYIKSGDARRVLVIGTETLSRVSDPHDRDSMLYADGAGATILEAAEGDTPVGILAHTSRSDAGMARVLHMDCSYNTNGSHPEGLFLKMNGRKLYHYALENVPVTVMEFLDSQGVQVSDLSKILIHQANGKMGNALVSRLLALGGSDRDLNELMPETVRWLGNSSVATIPTLLDLLLKGEMEPHELKPGDLLLFLSLGAGMNINSVLYRVPLVDPK